MMAAMFAMTSTGRTDTAIRHPEIGRGFLIARGHDADGDHDQKVEAEEYETDGVN